MKINLVVNSFPTPSETFLFNMVVGLESKGVDVTVIAATRSSYNEFYKHRQQEWSGKIKYIPAAKITQVLVWLKIIIKHYKLFNRLKSTLGLTKAISLCGVYDAIMFNHPDIVHFSFSGIAIQYNHITEEINKHCISIVSCRGTGEKVKPIVDTKRKLRLIETLNNIHAVHCVSDDMLDTICRYTGTELRDKSFINYPSIKIDQFNYNTKRDKAQTDCFVILTTGRLYYQKGYLVAMQSLHRLKQLGFNFQYHILGEGPDREMLQFVIHELHLSNNVKLHGRVDGQQVKKFLSESDIFLLPSLYEGISNAALEAMATGVPIVTTQAGGMAEVVKDGFNGKLIPCYDPYALADALAWVMSNYKDAVSMSAEARKTVEERFTHERQIQTYITKYEQLLAC